MENKTKESLTKEPLPIPQEVVEFFVETSLTQIMAKYEVKGTQNRLYYHDRLHTSPMISRVRQLLEIIHETNPEVVTLRDVDLGTIFAARHDVDQDWEPVVIDINGQSALKRRRYVTYNENKSAQGTIALMRYLNQDYGQQIFTKDDEANAFESIGATIPGFDPVLKTVIQPNLNKNSSIIAKCLALADLSNAGWGTPQEFLKDIDALFLEENLDVTIDLLSNEVLPEAKLKFYQSRYLSWLNSEPDYLAGRQTKLQTDVAAFPQESQARILALFPNFEATTKFIQQTIQDRSQLSPDQLLELLKPLALA